MKNRLIHCLIAVLLTLTGLSGCVVAGPITEPTPSPYPTPVRDTFIVQRGDVAILDNLYGRVAPVLSESASFQMEGKVAHLYVKVGDRVKAGQLLADLEELKALETDLAAANAEYEREMLANRNTNRRAEIDLEIAQLNLELFKSQNRSDYEIKIQELLVELAQMKLEETRASITQGPAADQVNEVKAAVEKAKLYAPIDGQIIAAVNLGRTIKTTTEAFVIGDSSHLEIITDASEEQLKLLKEGLEVTISPDGKPDLRLTGRIRQLPFPYGSGDSEELTVRVVLDQSPGAETYQNGDKMTVRVTLASKTGVLWLPPEAIRQAGGRTFVIVDTEAGPKRVDIEIGLESINRVEILTGLEEEQEVVGP